MATQNIDYNDLLKRGFLKQRQEGFFILRARMPSIGSFTPGQIRKISDIAEKYAKSVIHATVRQGLEIPFIKYEDISNIERELAESGINTGTSGTRLRATVVCPGNNWCRFGLINTFSLAGKIEDELGLECGLELPHKFKIAISGCPNTCTRPQYHDIGIHGQMRPDNTIGYVAYIGGCGGRSPRAGIKLDKIFTEDEVLGVIEKTVKFYKDHAKPRQRLGALIEERGMPI